MRLARYTFFDFWKELKMPRIVKLLPNQKEHAIRILDILIHMGVGFDTSETGSGKTYVTVSVIEDLIERGLCQNAYFILPNESLKLFMKVSNDLPINMTFVPHNKIVIGEIAPKSILVIDEIQCLSSGGKYSISLANSIIKALEAGCKILGLSATPFSGVGNVYTLFKHLGLVRFTGSTPTAKELRAFKFGELVQQTYIRIRKIPDHTHLKDRILDGIPPYDGTIESRMLAIHKFIMKIHSSECPRLLPDGLKIININRIYKTTYDEPERIKKLAAVRVATAFTMKQAASDLQLLELPYLADSCLRALQQNPNCKIIVAVSSNYHVGIMQLYFGKKGYACLTLNSDTGKKSRIVAQKLFNAYDLVYRVIIITFPVASMGLSLHDDAPRDLYPAGFPRTLVSFVDINPLRRTQLVGRHIRTGMTSSEVTTYMVTSNTRIDGELELDIFYNKSTADVDLITASIISTIGTDLYEKQGALVNPDIYKEVVELISGFPKDQSE